MYRLDVRFAAVLRHGVTAATGSGILDPGRKLVHPLTFARWHLGHIDWATALRSGGVTVTGPRDLRRALPTWNRRPEIGVRLRAARRRAASRPDPGGGHGGTEFTARGAG